MLSARALLSRVSLLATLLSATILLVILAGCGGGGGSGVRLSYQPLNPTVSVQRMLTLTATVTGTKNTAVSWLVVEGDSGGSITQAGVYTAPDMAGTYHVKAVSLADGTVSIVIPIIVQSSSATGSVQ